MCKILNWLSENQNWKDFLIPIIGSGIGVIGAYLIMLHQIYKQQKNSNLEISDNQSLLRSVYEINLDILKNRINTTLTPLTEHKDRILIEKLDFSITISEIYINTFDLLQQIDYVKLYESYRPIFLSSKANLFSDFINSYDNYKRLQYLMTKINSEFQSFLRYNNEINAKISSNKSNFTDIYKINLQSEKPHYKIIKTHMDLYYKQIATVETNEGYISFMNALFSTRELHHNLDEDLFAIIKLVKNNLMLAHDLNNNSLLLYSFLEKVLEEIPSLLLNIQSFINNAKAHYDLMADKKVTYI
ncbi:hypothetical protein [Sphingobacterium sp. JUb56]|uniref:hypothetical protein n=1 Tax=Sphingobacterium sp. JUb56 TaxID=2587145 RepID=UPI00160B16DD|nr:hypothetical protein [Sphingobacterium sp. JUb56]MBB2950167.1 hypothetical protein [Sphingobacterium sp. JUb56]